IVTLCQNPFGHREPADQDGIAGISFEGLAQFLHGSSCRRGFENSRAAIHHDGIANGMLLKESLRLEVLDLEADAARLVARQERQILLRQEIAWTRENGPYP